MDRSITKKRSIVKAVSYRLVILCLDFITRYWFTAALHVALGFMLASNLCTTLLLCAERARLGEDSVGD